MAEITSYSEGVPCWVDLAVTDVESASVRPDGCGPGLLQSDLQPAARPDRRSGGRSVTRARSRSSGQFRSETRGAARSARPR